MTTTISIKMFVGSQDLESSIRAQ